MATIEYNVARLSDLSSELAKYLAQLFKFPVRKTEKYLTDRFSGLKEDLFAVYEYPYVDRLYRDTYYHYYSAKHKPYFRDCVRISFFKSDFNIGKLMTYQSVGGDECLGFICIKPKFPNIFGRGALSPDMFKISNFETCKMESDILIRGARFKFKGFPFTAQDNEYMVCAETAIWETVEYFGNKYHEHRTILPSEIISTLSKFSHQRDVPSHGLRADQISFVLKQLGYGIRFYNRVSYEEDKPRYTEFFKILHYYVDSAIPVLGILKSKSDGSRHAVLYIGYKWPNFAQPEQVAVLKNGNELIEYADLVDQYMICDDNRMVYQFANFTLHGEDGYKYLNYYPENNQFELDAIIVPLPQKVYLEASQAKAFIQTVVKSSKIGIVSTSETVLKVFFTTSRSFKNWVIKNGKVDLRIKEIVARTTMPKFVWVGEISTISLLQKKEANGIIIVDATHLEANLDSLLFIWTSNSLWYYYDGSFKQSNDNIDAQFHAFQNFK